MKRRILCLLLAVIMLVSSLSVLTACGDDPVNPDDPSAGGGTHTHTTGDAWQKNANQHWKVCTDATCGAKVNSAAHTYVENADGTAFCSVCGQTCDHSTSTTEDLAYDAFYHWTEQTCNVCGIATEVADTKELHEYNVLSGDCACGRNQNAPDHDEHTYATVWTPLKGSSYHWKAPICDSADGRKCADLSEYITGFEYEEHTYVSGVCSVCAATELVKYDIESKYSSYDWAPTEIIICLNENSNNQELSSELRRYLAGDTKNVTTPEVVDTLVATRNQKATEVTNVTAKYIYWGENDTTSTEEPAGWGATVNRMVQDSQSSEDSKPDVFVNQIYDMISAQLNGAFLNTLSKISGDGVNHFAFTDPDFLAYAEETGDEFGYMLEYMSELGFSTKKQYLLASDYFIDLVRAFFVIPLNIKLLNGMGVASSYAGDRDDDGDSDTDDFYDMVMKGEWTYGALMDYCENIFRNTTNSTVDDLNNINGFALSTSNGLPSSGILYTTSVKIFDRQLNEATGLYSCVYPDTNPELEEFCSILGTVARATGVYTGAVPLLDIRDAFVGNRLLFGGIILLGSLEYQTYQDMKTQSQGFGILPVPLYKQYKDVKDESGNVIGKVQDNYLTLIHNMGRISAISAKAAPKFIQCTAYLDFQCTNSTSVINEYYNYNLQQNVAGGTKGNMEILQYIRDHVRSAFDKTYEDAIGFKLKDSGGGTNESWAGIISGSNYDCSTMGAMYKSNAEKRAGYLAEIVSVYLNDQALPL